MRKILEDLNKEVGFKGSMVITPDGFMVASALGPDLEEDLVAAIISSVLVSVKKALGQMNAPDELKSCVLNATGGKIMFYDVGNTFLVVVADMQCCTCRRLWCRLSIAFRSIINECC